MDDVTNLKPVRARDCIPFQCQLCRDCCRQIEDSIMLEPMDLYRLGRHLREKGEQVEGIEDVISRYAHPSLLDGNFPVMLLNTVGTDAVQVCAFLKAGCCSVYEARPRVCHMYPFSAKPAESGGGFQYFLCTERTHHFTGSAVQVKDWFRQNFSKEARAFLRAEYDAAPAIGQAIRRLGEEQFQKMLFCFLYYRYYNYDLDQPFLPQFQRNLAELKMLLSEKEGAP